MTNQTVEPANSVASTAAQGQRREIAVALIVATAVWLVFAFVGPGDDYFRAYSWMVLEPWRLPQVADRPWTLNPPWMIPFMAPFATMPGRAGYILFIAAMIGMLVYAAYVFGGKALPIVLSTHIVWILWWGQLEGWAALGLVLAWFGLHKKSWPLIAVALLLASFKPQVGLVPVVALWWWSGRDRWKAAAVVLVVFAMSLWIWGPWPVWYVQGGMRFAASRHYGPWNSSLGLVALPLFVPALALPLTRQQRLIALTATAYVASNYMPFYSTILLFCFALPWWAYLFAFVGYLRPWAGYLAWNVIVFLPLSVLAWLYYPYLTGWLRQRGWLKQSPIA